MARINIETSIYRDPEFQELLIKVGDRLRAKGMLQEFWERAQEQWFPHRKLVPMSVIEKLGLHQLIEVGLAEIRDGGVYARGSEKAFAWLFEASEKGRKGGKASAAKRKKKKSDQPVSTTCEAQVKQGSTSVNPSEASLLSSPSSLLSSLVSNSEKSPSGMGELALPTPQENLPEPKKSKFSESTRAKMQAFIAAYAKGYQGKYKGPPEGLRDKAIIGKIGHWIEHVPQERACQLVEVYLQIDYQPIANSQHDLWQFFRHLNRIGNALNSGQKPSGINWDKVFGGAA